MDPVTGSLVDDFVKSQQIKADNRAVEFEHFINYIVVSDVFSEEFDVERVATGEGEFGLDGVAIIVNDTLIEDDEQLDDIAQSSSSISVHLSSLKPSQDRILTRAT
jgi:hypothetical protein